VEAADAAIAELEAELHIAEVWRVRAEQAEAELARCEQWVERKTK
jgi:hypothetical protein